MEINHILIFSGSGMEADELVQAGLSEGSDRIHPGQGTTNRKFYFGNFFLEFVWVIDDKQVKNELTAPTGLWKRSCFPANGSSPFGFCFNPDTPELDEIFKESTIYKPGYIPEGTFFEIIPNMEQAYLPWVCRLPRTGKMVIQEEPTSHIPGMRMLTNVRIGIDQEHMEHNFISMLRRTTCIDFYGSPKHLMNLIFDNGNQGGAITFDEVPLTLLY